MSWRHRAGIRYICTCLLQEPFGCLYCLPKGSNLPVKVASGFLFPNGIVFKPGDPSVLIFAETSTKLLLAYDVTGPAKIENKRVWGKLPGTRGIKNHRFKIWMYLSPLYLNFVHKWDCLQIIGGWSSLITLLGPLLLTWFNFNPSMDK